MIGLGTSTHVACQVLDCKVTGKAPAMPGRPFICCKHLNVCNSTSLTLHAKAADQVLSLRRLIVETGDDGPALDNRERLRIAERIEAQAWEVLHDQVAAKFEVRP